MQHRIPRFHLIVPALLIAVLGYALATTPLAIAAQQDGRAGIAAASEAQPSTAMTLDRLLEPVVLRGSDAEELLGSPLQELFLVVYRDRRWSQVPFQIDEVDAGGTFTAFDDGVLGSRDEIVMMVRDLGDRAPRDFGGGLPIGDGAPSYVLEVSDPLDSARKGWAYLIRSSTLTPTNTTDYINYDVQSRRLSSEFYSLGLSTAPPALDYLELNGSGINILDRTKVRLFCETPGRCPLTENDLPASADGLIKDGPVRVILRNGTFLAYQSMVSSAGDRRLPQAVTGLRVTTDFTPAARGSMLYTAASPQGVTVDGRHDAMPLRPASNWWQLSTDHGTLIRVADIQQMGTALSNYYWDDFRRSEADTGDQRHFGEVGVTIARPRPGFIERYHLYFLHGRQHNLGDSYAGHFTLPLTVAVTRVEPGEVEDVRIGNPAISYLNIEFSSDMQYASWVELRRPPIVPSRVWICAIDPLTGALVPSDGRGVLVGEAKNSGWVEALPQWGQDSNGQFMSMIDVNDRLVLARPVSATEVITTVLPTPPNVTRLYPYPATLPERAHSYIAYLQQDEAEFYQAWYIDLAEPEVEHQVTWGDPGWYPPMETTPLSLNIHRWFDGEPVFIYGYTNTVTGKVQIAQFDVSQPHLGSVPITDDEYDHIDSFPANVDGERFLVGGVNNEARGMLHQRLSGSETYVPQREFVITESQLITPTSALSFEVFSWQGQAYTSFQIRDDSRAVLNRNEPGEIWIANLLDEPRVWRVNGPERMIRSDPEFYLGESEVWIFYSAKSFDQPAVWQLRRARAGLTMQPQE
jgi:hypothetical protein